MEFNRQPNKSTINPSNDAEIYSSSMSLQSPKSNPLTSTATSQATSAPTPNEESKLVGDLINLTNSINSNNQNSTFYNNLNEINQDMIDKVFNNFYDC